MHNVASLREAQHFLEQSKAAVDYWQRAVQRGEILREEHWRQIKALGFHDIGHARGELAKAAPAPKVEEHCASCGR